MSVRAVSLDSGLPLTRGRIADYFALTKARVVAMVLITTLAGFYLGARNGFELAVAINLLIGTAFAAGGTLALNQYIERDIDAIMERTRHRPLPDGRMRPVEALTFGAVTTTVGIAYLAETTNLWVAAVTASITVIYLFAYTPLKRVSWMCDVIGAVPGALPPVAGWAAARGTLARESFVIFAIMFLWQLPHTFAVARLYSRDYARAGIHLIPPDREGHWNPCDAVVVAASFALIAAGVAPALLGLSGIPSAIVAASLGAGMTVYVTAMVRSRSSAGSARRLLLASLVYLPLVLLVIVLDKA